MFYKNQTLGIVIDGPTTLSASKEVELVIDWKELHDEFAQRGQLLRTTYITPIFCGEDDHVQIRPMVDWMEYNGFKVITRHAREEDGDHGRRIKGGNIQVEFAIEAMRLAQHCNHIVLFTGDGSYAPLVSELQQMGCRVSVCCCVSVTSDTLRRKADNFIHIEKLRMTIGKVLA